MYTRHKFYGFNAHSINAFGVGAGWVSRNYFAGKVTPQDVLVKHTVFGFARLGLSTGVVPALGHRRPIDVLNESDGLEVVKSLLLRAQSGASS